MPTDKEIAEYIYGWIINLENTGVECPSDIMRLGGDFEALREMFAQEPKREPRKVRLVITMNSDADIDVESL